MDQKKQTPQVRFKGYTDTWEQRKLETISDVRDGTHDSPKYVQNGHPFITSKNVGNGFINYEDIQYVSDKDYDEINKRSKVDIHDILMGMIGTIGNLALIRKKPNFAIKNVALIKYTGDIDYKFLYQILQSHYVTSQLLNGMDGGTQKFIALNKIRGLGIPYPKEEEQRKIGSFFEQLDNFITLQQRKYNKLLNLKKAMSEKMFPQNGSLYPEIRFKGYTDAWEQRKLGECVSLRGRIGFRGYTQDDLVEEGEGAITYSPADIDEFGNVSNEDNKYIRWDKYKESPEIKVKEGDILFTKTASIGKVGYVRKLKEKATINPQFALLTPEKKYNGYFLFLSVRTNEFMKQVRDITGGSSVPTMSQKKLKALVIKVPLEEEQVKIGEYFNQLDNLITLYQRKVEKLKQIKKSCLEKMFV